MRRLLFRSAAMINQQASPTDLRLALRAAGYSPIPVQGKIPHLNGWQTKADASDAEIASWGKQFPHLSNTGLLTERMPTLDADIKYGEAADAVEGYVREHFDGRGTILVRFGAAPKRAIPLRTAKPFAKILRSFRAPDGSEQRIEMLGRGQQIVALGIHPDTKRPYTWHGGYAPGAVPWSDLPEIEEAEATRLVGGVSELLMEQFDYYMTTASGGGQQRPAFTSIEQWRELARGVPEGQRDVTAARLAGHLLRREVDAIVAYELLCGWALRCDPPLPPSDIRRIVNSIATKEMKRRAIEQ
jgi:Bifunctional DNA primase/polymerase, N-terminal/Primase C terminal 1 (PriCT-1)